MCLDCEMARRIALDGIPRYITADGRIMKCDWELSSEVDVDDLDGETLEEHIRSLLEAYGGA